VSPLRYFFPWAFASSGYLFIKLNSCLPHQ
jgi:hypothetical protein